MLESNVVHCTTDKKSRLRRRGVKTVDIKPLTVKQEVRARSIVAAEERRRALEDVDDETLERIEKFRKGKGLDKENESDSTAKLTREQEIGSYTPAFEYICYCGVVAMNEDKAPDPPKDMMSNGESDEEGWLDNLSAGEARELIDLVLTYSGMISVDDELGNGSDSSTPTAPATK